MPQLRSGQISLAVLFDDGTLDEFQTTLLLDERLSLIGAAISAGRPKKAVTLKQALALPLILPRIRTACGLIIEDAARRHALPPPNVVADISSVSILRTTLLAGIRLHAAAGDAATERHCCRVRSVRCRLSVRC